MSPSSQQFTSTVMSRREQCKEQVEMTMANDTGSGPQNYGFKGSESQGTEVNVDRSGFRSAKKASNKAERKVCREIDEYESANSAARKADRKADRQLTLDNGVRRIRSANKAAKQAARKVGREKEDLKTALRRADRAADKLERKADRKQARIAKREEARIAKRRQTRIEDREELQERRIAAKKVRKDTRMTDKVERIAGRRIKKCTELKTYLDDPQRQEFEIQESMQRGIVRDYNRLCENEETELASIGRNIFQNKLDRLWYALKQESRIAARNEAKVRTHRIKECEKIENYLNDLQGQELEISKSTQRGAWRDYNRLCDELTDVGSEYEFDFVNDMGSKVFDNKLGGLLVAIGEAQEDALREDFRAQVMSVNPVDLTTEDFAAQMDALANDLSAQVDALAEDLCDRFPRIDLSSFTDMC